MSEFKDYYNILGIDRDSTIETIGDAFGELNAVFQPKNRLGDKIVDKKFDEITEAYYVLSDPGRNSEYDQYYDYNLSQTNQQEPNNTVQERTNQYIPKRQFYDTTHRKKSKAIGCFKILAIVIIIIIVLMYYYRRSPLHY